MKKKVLLLTPWYPTPYDPMPGLFVKRHAELLTDLFEIAVLHTYAVESLEKPYEVDISFENNIYTIRIYYCKVSTSLAAVNLILKFYRFFRAHQKGFRVIQKYYGLPDFVHVNILTRVGLFAIYLKLRYKVPYVITEHWSRYLPSRNDFRGYFHKLITKIVVRKSAAISTVSQNLKKAMENCGLRHKNFLIINNVVDCDLFKPSSVSLPSSRKIFSHISCFDDKAKNVSGILRALKELSKQRNDFMCIMVGDGPDKSEVERLAEQLGLKDTCVKFAGLLEGSSLVEVYNQSAFTILFSNYENMPVVIPESLACGKPVISTNVGGIPEYIDESNGLLIEPGNEKALTESINYMLNNFQKYDSEQIRLFAVNLFGSEAVRLKLAGLYNFCFLQTK